MLSWLICRTILISFSTACFTVSCVLVGHIFAKHFTAYLDIQIFTVLCYKPCVWIQTWLWIDLIPHVDKLTPSAIQPRKKHQNPCGIRSIHTHVLIRTTRAFARCCRGSRGAHLRKALHCAPWWQGMYINRWIKTWSWIGLMLLRSPRYWLESSRS